MGSGWRQLSPDCSEQPNPSEWGQARPRLGSGSAQAGPGSVLPHPALPRPLPCLWLTHQRGPSPAEGSRAQSSWCCSSTIQKGTIQLQDTSLPAWRHSFPFPAVPRVLVRAAGTRRLPLPSPPLRAFPSALTTDSGAGGTHSTPNSSGELGVLLSLISSSSRCFSPKAGLVAVRPSSAAGVCQGWTP